MIAAILMVISVAALVQFAVCYWRSVVAGVASDTLPERVRAAAGLSGAAINPRDFNSFVDLYDVTPSLQERSNGLWAVRAYYRTVETLGRLAGLGLPGVSAWTEREMTVCSRYVAVLVGQRMERNLACASEMRSS